MYKETIISGLQTTSNLIGSYSYLVLLEGNILNKKKKIKINDLIWLQMITRMDQMSEVDK